MVANTPRARRSSRGLLCAAGSYMVMGMLLLSACSSSLPRPPTGRVPTAGMMEVPYPPPPARVEVIPPQPGKLDVWIDGQWDWGGRAWQWLPGSWLTPPPNAYFTRWTTMRTIDGRLLFARAAWRRKDGRPLEKKPGAEVCPPSPSAPASAGPGREMARAPGIDR
jgi:hypothetical protein